MQSILSMVLLHLSLQISGRNYFYNDKFNPEVKNKSDMTYSILASDPKTGAIGVATATGSVAVGGFVPHVRFGVGAVATQGAFTNWLHGENGLKLLKKGHNAEAVRDMLVKNDKGSAYRQFIICDRWGHTAGHTGAANLDEKLHYCGEQFAVAGNMLDSQAIVAVMRAAFEAKAGAPLHERLLHAMSEGERHGGDFRGTHSAAIKVQYADIPPVDLRVDWSEKSCIDELRVLYEKTQSHAYQRFLQGVPTYQNPDHHGTVSDEEVK